MARPVQKRVVELLPEYAFFHSDGIASGSEITLTTDEFETIRLLDKEHLTQEECAARMNVSRATVTSIYQKAREKLALLIVDGRNLSIGGGCFTVKGGNKTNVMTLQDKGENTMRIAVTYSEGEIFQHFGRTEEFKIYDVEDGKINAETVVGADGQGHGALAGVLSRFGVDVLICGGIGGGAQEAVKNMGIKLCGGVSGSADEAVKAYLEGRLESQSTPTCNHHHHEEGHSCSGKCGGHCHH